MFGKSMKAFLICQMNISLHVIQNIFYKEVVYEQKQYEKPDVIIAQIEELDRERQQLLKDLKKMLAEDFTTGKKSK